MPVKVESSTQIETKVSIAWLEDRTISIDYHPPLSRSQYQRNVSDARFPAQRLIRTEGGKIASQIFSTALFGDTKRYQLINARRHLEPIVERIGGVLLLDPTLHHEADESILPPNASNPNLVYASNCSFAYFNNKHTSPFYWTQEKLDERFRFPLPQTSIDV